MKTKLSIPIDWLKDISNRKDYHKIEIKLKALHYMENNIIYTISGLSKESGLSRDVVRRILEESTPKLTPNSQAKTNRPLTLQTTGHSKATPKATGFTPPTEQEIRDYLNHLCKDHPEYKKYDLYKFLDHYSMKGWMVGKTKMVDWKAAIRNSKDWCLRETNIDDVQADARRIFLYYKRQASHYQKTDYEVAVAISGNEKIKKEVREYLLNKYGG